MLLNYENHEYFSVGTSLVTVLPYLLLSLNGSITDRQFVTVLRCLPEKQLYEHERVRGCHGKETGHYVTRQLLEFLHNKLRNVLITLLIRSDIFSRVFNFSYFSE